MNQLLRNLRNVTFTFGENSPQHISVRNTVQQHLEEMRKKGLRTDLMGARGRRRDGRRGDEGEEGRGDGEGRRGDEGEGEDKMQGVIVEQTREEGEEEKQQKQPDDLPELMETLASFSIRS